MFILSLEPTCVFHMFPLCLRRVLILTLASTLSLLLLLLLPLLLFPWLSHLELLAEQLHIVIEQLKDLHPVSTLLLLLLFQLTEQRFVIKGQFQILLTLPLVQTLPSAALTRSS